MDDATYQTLRAQYAPLRAWLAEEAIDTDTVVSATVFTTQTITADLDAIYAQIEDELPAPPMDDAQWQALDGDATPYSFMESYAFREGAVADYHVLQGRYVAPNYQEGALPYMNEGGALHFVDGEPEPVFDETIRFVLTVPNTPPNEGLDCYPIVMYAHGTGGSANSMRYDDTAGRLAGRGIAAISIDQPFHAFRAAGQMIDVDLLSFNFFNVDSFRANFRQAAIDTFSLTRFVKASLREPSRALRRCELPSTDPRASHSARCAAQARRGATQRARCTRGRPCIGRRTRGASRAPGGGRLARRRAGVGALRSQQRRASFPLGARAFLQAFASGCPSPTVIPHDASHKRR